MQDNPYAAFWGLLHTDSAERAMPKWLLGRVRTEEPLCIERAGQMLTRTELLVNADMLEHERDIKQTEITGSLPGSHDVTVNGGSVHSKATMESCLKEGDQVLLLPSEDMQQFIVLCKLI